MFDMTKKKSTSGKNKYRTLSLRPPTELNNIIKQLADEEQRTTSKMAEILLKEALRQRGLWPPSEPILR